jgi:hypothetical protein
VRTAVACMQARLDTDKPFLWIDETTDRALRVGRGEIMVMPMVGQGTRDVPERLIHDWIGGVFIPNARIDKLLARSSRLRQVQGDIPGCGPFEERIMSVVTDSEVLRS